jgi:CHAD domain-containing protein
VLHRDRAAEHAEADRAARLHDVRKAAKRLRYAAEAAGEPVLADRAEALQEQLGAGNDALMTVAWLDRTARELPDEADRLRAESARQWTGGRLDDAAYALAVEALRDARI